MLWEFGEHLKSLLDLIGFTDRRLHRLCPWFICWCEARRTWLNEIGEFLWREADTNYYHLTRRRFRTITMTSLEAFPLRESSLLEIFRLNGIPVSPHTAARWLSQMVADDILSEMIAPDGRWLSLR